MTISKDSAVFLHYTLTDTDSNVIDKSPEGEPLGYLHGHKNIIPGLEKQLEGKTAGDKLIAVVEPAEGYGEYNEEAIQEVPREHFHGVDTIEPGMQFQSEVEGKEMLFTVKTVSDKTVVIDGNHPLAGKQLSFDVEITEVREASSEELEHGHIHGQGGVEH